MNTGTLVVRLKLIWVCKGLNCCKIKVLTVGTVIKLTKILPLSWKLALCGDIQIQGNVYNPLILPLKDALFC